MAKERRYCPECNKKVLAEKQSSGFLLHIILIVLSGGLWIPFALLAAMLSPSDWLCPNCGARTKFIW
jgi:hypothetical protein